MTILCHSLILELNKCCLVYIWVLLDISTEELELIKLGRSSICCMTNSFSSLNSLEFSLLSVLKFFKNTINLSLFLIKISKIGLDFFGLATKILNTLNASNCKFLDLSLSKIMMSFKFCGEST